MLKPKGYWKGLFVLLALLVPIAGCGGSDGEAESPLPKKTVTAKVYTKTQPGIPADVGQWMVDIGADPDGDPAFTVAKVVVPPGNANFRLRNPSGTDHVLTIHQGSLSVSTEAVHEGSAWVRASFYPGRRYVFYCSIPGHRKAGMEGTIEVDPGLESADLKPF